MRRRNIGRTPGTRWFWATVDRQDVGLESEAESNRVKRACVAAVRRGGAIVRFNGGGGRWTDFLITPGLTVSFDELVVPHEAPLTAEQLAGELSPAGRGAA